jgi:uncharacterized membrane protein YoaK (UPF0700 family)
MITFFDEIKQTLFPRPDTKDGPLPPLLVGLTVVTGLVDSFSYLVLGHVFVANMTGNVVFIAFALAGVPGFSLASSLIAIGSFVLGSLGGGVIGSHVGQSRGRLLWIVTGIQAAFVGVGVILAILSRSRLTIIYTYALIIPLGISMGLQNSTARKLAVPDLTTTVLTLTITGMSADSRLVGGSGSKAGRRLISVLAMFIGALFGALTILYVSIIYPLVLGFIAISIVSIASKLLSRGNPAWVNAK